MPSHHRCCPEDTGAGYAPAAGSGGRYRRLPMDGRRPTPDRRSRSRSQPHQAAACRAQAPLLLEQTRFRRLLLQILPRRADRYTTQFDLNRKEGISRRIERAMPYHRETLGLGI